MKITILASGSGGNATLFEAGGTRVLVDAGIGPRALAQRLAASGTTGLPHAVVVTHAHQDHLGQCLRLAGKLKIPIYASEATARAEMLLGRPEVRVFGMREPFAIGALIVAPTPLPHDAAQVALVLSSGGRRAAIVTDLGEVPPALAEALAGVDVALIESNHDAEMLSRGPYPAFLKRRVASARGHLSNAQAHALLQALPRETHTVVLMHLSETNNRPALAMEMARDALAGRGTRLLCAPPRETIVLDAAARPAPVAEAARPAPAMEPARPAPVAEAARPAPAMEPTRPAPPGRRGQQLSLFGR
jgi:phosphoribosyl 1,2-cyclic phosphodiesterase